MYYISAMCVDTQVHVGMLQQVHGNVACYSRYMLAIIQEIVYR